MNTENVVLVTGASRGIGKAIATHLGAQGYIIAGTATSEAGAESISNYLKENDIIGLGLVMNVGEPQSISDGLSLISESYAAPKILVNNAGITKDNLLLRMKDEEWQDVINVNLTALYRLSKACLRPMMKARWGRIVNVSSVVGAIGNAGQVNYAATKAGAVGFTKSLAREVASRGITVNAVAPGYIESDMTKALSETQSEALGEQIPLGRLGSPNDIAYAVDFLISDKASYITGETIHINGGMFMS